MIIKKTNLVALLVISFTIKLISPFGFKPLKKPIV